MSLKEGTEWVAEIASNVPNPTLYVESNQSQRWLAQELADYGLNVTQVQTGRNKEEKLLSMSIPVENGVVRFVNHETDEQLGYDPRWQNLIDEALAFPEGSHDDLLDSLHIVIENAQIGETMALGTDMYGRDDE
jgi:predicted phage terminase large subunit-like protein